MSNNYLCPTCDELITPTTSECTCDPQNLWKSIHPPLQSAPQLSGNGMGLGVTRPLPEPE